MSFGDTFFRWGAPIECLVLFEWPLIEIKVRLTKWLYYEIVENLSGPIEDRNATADCGENIVHHMNKSDCHPEPIDTCQYKIVLNHFDFINLMLHNMLKSIAVYCFSVAKLVISKWCFLIQNFQYMDMDIGKCYHIDILPYVFITNRII